MLTSAFKRFFAGESAGTTRMFGTLDT